MKVTYEKNSNLDIRHGLFTITNYNKKTFPPYSFALKSTSNSKYLCTRGWKDACAPHVVQGFQESNKTLLLFVDMTVVQLLNPQETYTFSLISYEQAPQTAILEFTAIDSSEPNNEAIATNSSDTPQIQASSDMPISDMPINDGKIINNKLYPLIVWFLAIWLSGCLIFGYLMFKDNIDAYFAEKQLETEINNLMNDQINDPANTQNTSSNVPSKQAPKQTPKQTPEQAPEQALEQEPALIKDAPKDKTIKNN